MHPYIAVPATTLLVIQAYKHKSLTNTGIFFAALTAAAHAYHPWNTPFVLLCVFYLLGSKATKVKHNVKVTLTLQAKGNTGGEGPRNYIQVLANSIVATILTVLHAYELRTHPNSLSQNGQFHLSLPRDLYFIGIIANYAAVTADTLSSELGILSSSPPRLITSFLFKSVPHGTNGGVSILGFVAGFVGAVIIGGISILLTPFSPSRPATLMEKVQLMGIVGLWGFFGSVLDSLFGALLQRTVRDVRTGKVVEGEGGARVLVHHNNPVPVKVQDSSHKPLLDKTVKKIGAEDDEHIRKPSREVVNGWDILDNNQVNFLMALIMSVGAVFVVQKLGLPGLAAYI